MKNLFLVLLLTILLSTIAQAANYTVGVTWPDPTTPGPSYTPSYDVEWRLSGGSSNPINNLSSPNAGFSISNVNGGESLEVRQRATNTQGAIVGNWSGWSLTQVPSPPTIPADQGAVTFQFTVIVP